MPEIYLYEYPLSDVPVELDQPITLLNLHPSAIQHIRSLEEAIKKTINRYYNPPTNWLDPLLLANAPNFLRGFHWRWGEKQRKKIMEPAIMLDEVNALDSLAALIHSWVVVWREAVQTNYIDALAQAESLVACVTNLWQQKQLLTPTSYTLSDIVLDEEGQLNSFAYDLVPAILLRQLLGQRTLLASRQEAVWELAVGRDETYIASQLLRADNGGAFAYKLEANLQTLVGSSGEIPVVHIGLKQQRYPDGLIETFPQNTHSVLLRTGNGLWCKVSSDDYRHVRREAAVGTIAMPEWDSLPNLETLHKNPGSYLDMARIIYLTGMKYLQDDATALHPLEVGMSFGEEWSLLDPIIGQLNLNTATEMQLDTQLKKLFSNLGRRIKARSVWSLDRLKVSKAGDPDTILRDRIMAATDGKGLEIVVITRQSHTKLIDEILPNAIEGIFTVKPQQIETDLWQILPDITCRIIRLSVAEADLLEPLAYELVSEEDDDGKRKYRTARWRPAYQQRYYQLADMLRTHLPLEQGAVRFALVDKPAPLPGNAAFWQDVKGIARAALAELGYLSQFVNPYREGKDGIEYNPKDVSYRVRQGLLDGLRQIGVVLGIPAELYELVGLPSLNVISMTLLQAGKDIFYPMFSRLSPDGGIDLCHPTLDGKLTDWIPSYLAIPELIRMIWKTVDKLKSPGTYRQGRAFTSPLKLANGVILDYMRNILDTSQPSVLIVPAEKIRNWNVWPQLKNQNLGQHRHRLILGSVDIERDHPAWSHLLGIVRYRGPEREVPEYYPVSDGRGKSLDFLAPQAWFTEDAGLIRYLGVGVTQSTAANRETIHQDAHSLLHSKRKRPRGKEIEVGASYRYAHARLIEFVPFFVSPSLGEEGPIALCRLAQLTRMMGWHSSTLSLPWPTHIAATALQDALDVIAKYAD